MLLQLRDFIMRVGEASTQRLAREFCIAETALEPMLAYLERKGTICKVTANLACGSICKGCNKSEQVLYRVTK